MKYRSAFTTVDDVIRQIEITTNSDNDLATAIDTLITTKYANQVARIKRLLYEISEKIEQWCGQTYVPYHWTYNRKMQIVKARREYYSIRGDLRFDVQWANDALLDITSLTWNGALMASTTYAVGDGSYSPSEYITLDPDQSWDNGVTSFTSAVAIVGVWGYHGNYSALWADSGDTVQDGGGINASVTSITVTSGANFETYQYLQIESEWLFVTNISSNTLTVQRGVLGTTAATHANATSIDIMQVDDTAKAACRRLVVLEYLNPGETRTLAPLPDGTIVLGTTQENVPLPVKRSVWGAV